MNPVTPSPSAIARSGPTPEFEALCKTLYGDVIDPEAVWDEVIKAGPDQADVHASSQRKQAAVAFGSNTFGAGMGALAIKDAVRHARGKVSGGKLVPTKAKVAAGLIAAGQIANVGGDVNSMAVTGRQALGPQKKSKVGKAGAKLIPLERIAQGHVAHGQSLIPSAAGRQIVRSHVVDPVDIGNVKAYSHSNARSGGAPKPAAAKTPRQSKAYRAGANVRSALTTTAGRTGIGLGVGGTLAAQGSGKAISNARAQAEPGYETYYGKADDSVVFKGDFSEINEDQRTAFGWASVTEIGGMPVVDRQGDYITTEDIEKAAYDYVHKSRVGGDMHRRTQSLMGDQAHKVSDMIESVVFTDEKIAKMGLPEDFPRGWWVGFKIHDDETWDLVKKGERTGFSIHGKGIRKDLSLDQVMGY